MTDNDAVPGPAPHALSRRAAMGALAVAGAAAPAMAVPAMAVPAMAATGGGGANAADAAWANYLRVIDEARTLALTSRWAHSPQLRAQAEYYISMLQAFGFNLYMAPRHAYPTFYSHTVFTPVEYQWGAPSPDFRYHWTAIDGRRRYRIWGTRGNTPWLHIQAQKGWWGDADQRNIGSWDVDDFTRDAEGRFEIIASADPQPGNWMKLDRNAPNTCLLVRDIWDDWANAQGATIHIECIDPRPDDTVLLSEEQVAERLGKIAFQTRFSVQWYQDDMARVLNGAGGTNRFWAPDTSSTNLGGNPQAAYVKMVYDIRDDEALIVETALPNARYWSLQMADPWFQTTDYRFHQTSLNRHQTHIDADGKVRMVIAGSDPGAANWIDTAGLPYGLAMWRWYLSDRHLVPNVRKMPLSRVRESLPAGTPFLAPEQRAARLAARNSQVMRRFGV